MANDSFVGFRISSELKRQVMEVAEETQRSMSQAFLLLLARGIEVYRKDGFLVDTKPKPKPEEESEKSAAAKKRAPTRATRRK
jgi:hypothetical protein